jgi:hypothetical protein
MVLSHNFKNTFQTPSKPDIAHASVSPFQHLLMNDLSARKRRIKEVTCPGAVGRVVLTAFTAGQDAACSHHMEDHRQARRPTLLR